jgi:hypothetical protein
MSNFAASSPEDRVRAVAFSLWIEEGMPEGRAESHWFKALELVNAEAATTKPARRTAAAAAPKKVAALAVAKKAAPRKRG